jgi:hypothetical protein
VTPETSEILALKALTWLSAQETLMDRFCALAGLAPSDLLVEAERSETLAAVLDFLLQDEQSLLVFCQDHDIAPELPMRARAYLPGGDLPHWT